MNAVASEHEKEGLRLWRQEREGQSRVALRYVIPLLLLADLDLVGIWMRNGSTSAASTTTGRGGHLRLGRDGQACLFDLWKGWAGDGLVAGLS